MNRRRLFVCVFLVLIGLMPLFNSLGNPRLKGLHGSDFVQLIAVGICFGVAFGILVGRRTFRGE
jgi:hypothetical protein